MKKLLIITGQHKAALADAICKAHGAEHILRCPSGGSIPVVPGNTEFIIVYIRTKEVLTIWQNAFDAGFVSTDEKIIQPITIVCCSIPDLVFEGNNIIYNSTSTQLPDALKIINEVEQSKAHVERMYWIGFSLESAGLMEFMEDFIGSNYPDFEAIFPGLAEAVDGRMSKHNRDTVKEYFIDNKMCGIIAECYYPKRYNFSFKDCKPISCSCNPGHSLIFYVYANTLEELLVRMRTQAEVLYTNAWQKELATKNFMQ